MKKYELALIAMLFILFITTSAAQQLVWKHTGGPMGGIIGDIAINSKGEIYAGVYPNIFDYYAGLYKSTDDGDTWNKIETQFEDFEVYSIYITEEDHIWAGTNYQGRIYLSKDNGETWENKRNGYNGGECWAFGQSNDGVLFAGDGEYDELYRSTDYGENWELSENLPPLVFATDSNNIVYAGTHWGLFATSDNGDKWAQNIFLSDKAVAAILIDKDNNIYCGTGYYDNGDGVWYSTDGGVNWRQLGLEGKVILSLAFDSEGNLYAGTKEDGLYMTTDMGENWYHYTEGIYNEQVFRLKINEQDDIFTGSENEGVYRLKHNSNFFEQVGLPISKVSNFVFSGDSLIFAATPSGVQEYNRITKQWTNKGLQNVNAVTITPGGNIYAAAAPAPFSTTSFAGLYKSTDLGQSWSYINIAKDTSFILYNVLAVNDDTVFAAIEGNLRRSFDGGLHWDILPVTTFLFCNSMCLNNQDLWVLGLGAVFPHNNLFKLSNFGEIIDSIFTGFSTPKSNNNIFAIDNYVFLADPTRLEGIIRSTDDGKTWEQTLFRENLISIYADKKGLVIGGADSVYISSNYGESWSGYPQPIMDRNRITEIKKDNTGKFFFGTTRQGLYEIEMITDVEDEKYIIPEDFVLYQNYPNPFNPSTKIKYEITNPSFVMLKVFDILGREVTTLINEQKPAGIYEITFDASSLSSGVYIYRITAFQNNRILFSQSKQMILIK